MANFSFRVKPTFPTSVSATNGISLTKTNGHYEFAIDWDSLPDSYPFVRWDDEQAIEPNDQEQARQNIGALSGNEAVRYDEAQSLTSEQQEQARANIDFDATVSATIDATTKDIPSDQTDKMPAPQTIKAWDYRWPIFAFAGGATERAKDESAADFAPVFRAAAAAREKVEFPPWRYVMRSTMSDDNGAPCAVYSEVNASIDWHFAGGATVVVPADWPTNLGTFANLFVLRTGVSLVAPGAGATFNVRGLNVDATAYTAVQGAADTTDSGNVLGLSIFNIYQFAAVTDVGGVVNGGVTTPDGATAGWGAIDSYLNTHQCAQERVIGKKFIGLYDLPYYPSGRHFTTTLGSDPLTSFAGTRTVRVNRPSHGVSIGHHVSLDGATSFDGLDATNINKGHVVTNVHDANHFDIVLAAGSNASAGTTGGGSAVTCALLTRMWRFDDDDPRGINLIYRDNYHYRCRNCVSPKRGWRSYFVENNFALECDSFMVEGEGGNHLATGSAGTVRGNRGRRIQRAWVFGGGGGGMIVTDNNLEDFGRWISDGVTESSPPYAYLFDAMPELQFRGNITRQKDWTGTGKGLWLRNRGEYPSEGQTTRAEIDHNIFDGMNQAIDDASGGVNAIGPNTILNETTPSNYGSSIAITRADDAITHSVAVKVPDIAYSSAWDGDVSVPTKNAIYDAINGGRWTPTITGVANVSSSTPQSCHYLRIGNHVMCWGEVTIDATAAANTVTSFGVSLPIPTNLASIRDALGVATAYNTSNAVAATVSGDTSNERAQIDYLAPTTSTMTVKFSFTYEIK